MVRVRPETGKPGLFGDGLVRDRGRADVDGGTTRILEGDAAPPHYTPAAV